MKRLFPSVARRASALLLAFVLCAASLPAYADEAPGALYQPDFEPAAPAVYMLSDTGTVVYQKNENEPYVAASLVKLMTCMLVMDHVDDVDATRLTSDKTWIYDELYGKNASHADIRLGETLSVRELLYAMLLPSANEAALLLADHVSSGNRENFLFMMDARAKKLGCTGTTFADPNGLSEDNRTTAHDMALMMKAFMEYPLLAEIAATPSYEMAAHEQHSEPYLLHTTNRLIVENSLYYNAFPAVSGTVAAGKTGSLGEWQNFASVATKDGMTYYLAVMNSPYAADEAGAKASPPQTRPALYESARLYNWAFTTLSVRPALDTSQPITEVKVRYSTEQDYVNLLPTSDLRTILPKDADDSMIQKEFDVPDHLAAPVEQGQQVGTVTLTLEGQEIGRSDLVAQQSVKRNTVLFVVKKVGEFTSSGYFKVALLVLVVLVAGYIGFAAMQYNRKKQGKTKK